MANHAQYWFKPSGRLSQRAVADAFWDMLTAGVLVDKQSGTAGSAKIPKAAQGRISTT